MIKENSEAQSAVVVAASAKSPEALRAAIKEVSESIQADTDAKRALEAALLAAESGAEPVSL
jgi:hypothetical protein